MKRVSFKISIIYLIVGILWIFFSDEVVALIVQDKTIITRLSIVKGWLFIAVTAVMLYWLITRYVGEIKRSHDFYLKIFEDFPTLIWRAGTDAQCDYFNNTWLSFTGRTLAQEMGAGWAEGVHPDDLDRCLNTFLDAFHARQPFTMEYRLRRHDGEFRWISDYGRPIFDLDHEFAGYVGSCHDITERKEVEKRLKHLSIHDSLTGIHNRAFFDAELSRVCEAGDFPASIILFDIDGLKAVNDSAGHAAGDGLIQATAQVLRKVVRTGDTLARIGGDEFALILPGARNTVALDALERIRSAIAAYNAENSGQLISMSLGVATADNADALNVAMIEADRTMYQDKFFHRSQAWSSMVSPADIPQCPGAPTVNPSSE